MPARASRREMGPRNALDTATRMGCAVHSAAEVSASMDQSSCCASWPSSSVDTPSSSSVTGSVSASTACCASRISSWYRSRVCGPPAAPSPLSAGAPLPKPFWESPRGLACDSVIQRRSAASRRHTSVPIHLLNMCRFSVAHCTMLMASAADTAASMCSDCSISTEPVALAPISWCRRFGSGSRLGFTCASGAALGSYGAARMPPLRSASRRSRFASSCPACCALWCSASRSRRRGGKPRPGPEPGPHAHTGPSSATTSAANSSA
mmetsp:Transcript_30335/g.96810  ORF Transcript_30335/g.96810 Transcript_30335/m.96810 type:complete len:265 (+) Transcript_30335:93-887(+)